MKLNETVNWNPVTGDWEHIVQASFEDVAKDNAFKRNSGEKGFILRAEAKEKYEIPVELMYDECVRNYVLSGGKDKLAEKMMLDKYGNIVKSSADGVNKQRIFMGGENIVTSAI